MPAGLSKSTTGIQGLNEVTFDVLTKGRRTLVCCSAGNGKTLVQEAQARSLHVKRGQDTQRLQRELKTMRKVMEARVEALRSEYDESKEEEVKEKLLDENKMNEASAEERKAITRLRKADVAKGTTNSSNSQREP